MSPHLKIRPKLRRLTAVLLSSLLLCACSNTTPPALETPAAPTETTAPTPSPNVLLLAGEGAPAYAVVRPEKVDDITKEAALKVFRALGKINQDSLITTDYKDNPISDYEIVIGDTTRFALDMPDLDLAVYGEQGYFIRAVGSRIYICGGTPEATMAAAEVFLAAFLAEGAAEVAVAGNYLQEVHQSYPITDIKVAGHSLRDFVITWDDSLSEAAATAIAEEISSALRKQTGINLKPAEQPASGTPTVRLSARGSDDFSMAVEGNHILLSTTAKDGLARGFAQFTAEQLRGKSGEITLDAGYKFTAEVGKSVAYSQFGAMGDGETDDMAAIIAAHDYANQNGLAVRADKGATYYIGSTAYGAAVMTDTDWTGASFIIDDREVDASLAKVGIFNVISAKSAYSLDGKIKPLKRTATNLGITLPEESVVILTDTTTKRYIRQGTNANQGSAQSDVLLVDKDGNIDPRTPLLWDYDNISSVQVIPCDAETITIRGGAFTTLANVQANNTVLYLRGIIVRRSNVVFDGFTHNVEKKGTVGPGYSGFFIPNSCANITVKNCVFTPNTGSYDITATGVLNLTFDGCSQTIDILDTKYWGIMGSNFCKNMVVRDCTFSRVDAHQGVANLTIQGSTLGHQCLNAIGMGTLLVEDSTLYGSAFINLRSDYGSTWEGEVIIRNCKWIPKIGQTLTAPVSIIGGSNNTYHDFGYECYLPQKITIDGLHIENSKYTGSGKLVCILADFTPAYRSDSFNAVYPYHVPETVTVRNITTASGTKWQLSSNSYLFREVKVIEE